MKIWILNHHAYGESAVFAGFLDPREYPPIMREIQALEDGYIYEVEQFNEEIMLAMEQGYGEVEIEERLTLSLQDLTTSFD